MVRVTPVGIEKKKSGLLSEPCLVFVSLPANKVPGAKEKPDVENANHPPPAKLLQDWARTPLPHVCPYCGKTFTRRVFLRAHVFSHTGEKLFTCKVTASPLFPIFVIDS